MPALGAKQKKSVNLVLREGFEHTTLGKVLTWGLSVGRIIVILTELVVIVAFLSRFWLDRMLTDLNEDNASLKRQVEAVSTFENDFRLAQERIETFKKVTVKTEYADRVTDISALLPQGVTLSKISFMKREINLTGIALSEEGLAGFVSALSKSEKFQDISLSSVTLETERIQGLAFQLKGGLTNASGH